MMRYLQCTINTSIILISNTQSFERIRQALEQCDIDHDIATFIDLKGVNTGKCICNIFDIDING
jgi:hypothetical protein